MGNHKTIVVIEDDPSLQQDLTIASVEAGLVVHNAYDGEEGVRLVLEKRPDIVLLDLILPKKDGFKVLEEIKEDPRIGPFLQQWKTREKNRDRSENLQGKKERRQC